MRKVVSIVLCLLLCLSSVPVFAADANSLPEPVVYYNFDGDEVLEESLNDGAYDGKATIGDPDNFDGASIAQVDSMEGYGKAAKFVETARAEGAFAQLPAGMMPALLDDDFTFSFWFKGDAGTLYTTVFCFGYTGVNYYIKLSFNGTKQLYVDIRDENNVSFNLGNSAETGSLVDGTDGWHFYTLSCERGNDADVVKFYIDGSLIEQKTDAKLPVYSEITTENNAFNIFGEAFWGDPIVGGLLDEFRIYDSALNAEQITALQENPFAEEEQLGNDGGSDNEGTGNEGAGNENGGDDKTEKPVTGEYSIVFALAVCLGTMALIGVLKAKRLCK